MASGLSASGQVAIAPQQGQYHSVLTVSSHCGLCADITFSVCLHCVLCDCVSFYCLSLIVTDGLWLLSDALQLLTDGLRLLTDGLRLLTDGLRLLSGGMQWILWEWKVLL